VRRGISLTAGLSASLASRPSASAAITLLRKATVKAVLHHVAGKTGTLSAEVVALAHEALPIIVAAKARLDVGLLLTLSLMATGAALLGYQPVSPAQIDKRPGESIPPAKQVVQEEKRHIQVDRYGDPLPPSAIARLGTVRFRVNILPLCVAYTPDGKLLAVSDWFGVIHIWEASTGKEVRTCIGGRPQRGWSWMREPLPGLPQELI
jgi:hypothetical protein